LQFRPLLTRTTWDRYEELFGRRLQERIVRQDASLCWCPAPDCSTIVRRDFEAAEARCHDCAGRFCPRCLRKPHKGSCDEALKRAGRRAEAQQELEFQRWAKRATKSCPQCHVKIQRNDDHTDCNHMICEACKTEFCWLCGDKVRDCPFKLTPPFVRPAACLGILLLPILSIDLSAHSAQWMVISDLRAIT